jgi:hypothetical protein
MGMVEYVGWVATVVFAGSYFCRQPENLRRAQMVGALMWVAYGLFIESAPVVAANLLVVGAAGWASIRSADGTDTRHGTSRRPVE